MNPDDPLIDALLSERKRLGVEDDELFLEKLETQLNQLEKEGQHSAANPPKKNWRFTVVSISAVAFITLVSALIHSLNKPDQDALAVAEASPQPETQSDPMAKSQPLKGLFTEPKSIKDNLKKRDLATSSSQSPQQSSAAGVHDHKSKMTAGVAGEIPIQDLDKSPSPNLKYKLNPNKPKLSQKAMEEQFLSLVFELGTTNFDLKALSQAEQLHLRRALEYIQSASKQKSTDFIPNLNKYSQETEFKANESEALDDSPAVILSQSFDFSPALKLLRAKLGNKKLKDLKKLNLLSNPEKTEASLKMVSKWLSQLSTQEASAAEKPDS